MSTLQCDMTFSCTNDVTHIDDKGYVYCETHGIQRRSFRPTRKLRPHEKNKLERGETIRYKL